MYEMPSWPNKMQRYRRIDVTYEAVKNEFNCRICLVRHLKGIRKCDELGEVTNYANRCKLYHRSSHTLSY